MRSRQGQLLGFNWSNTIPSRYSRKAWEERENFPRTHYSNGVKKQAAIRDSYKPTVRLFKRWARQYPSLVAPSFYIECSVHSVSSSEFSWYLPMSFYNVARQLIGYYELDSYSVCCRGQGYLALLH